MCVAYQKDMLAIRTKGIYAKILWQLTSDLHAADTLFWEKKNLAVET